MGLLQDCQDYFNTTDLYEILGISRTASDNELKAAYKKKSLIWHPDRVDGDKKDEATKKFQALSKVHALLTDKEKRVVYDETGSVDDENLNLEDKNWDQYWRLLFPRITKRDIEKFMEKYKGSEEELEDLKNFYVQYEGDMNKISECFLGYDVEEEENLRHTISELIEKKEIPDFPKFTKETKSKRNARVKRFKRESKEAEKVKTDEEFSLVDAIMKRTENREKQFNEMIESLEAKYAKPAKRRKK